MNTAKEIREKIKGDIIKRIDKLREKTLNDPQDGRVKNDLNDLLDELKKIEISEVEDKTIESEHVLSKKENQKVVQKLRSWDVTEKILKKMTLDKLIYSLEERLSKNQHYWYEANIKIPKAHDSYVFWYCKEHAKAYQDLCDSISEIKWDEDFKDKLRTITAKAKRRNDMLFDLMPNTGFSTLSNRLTTLQKYQTQLIAQLISADDSEVTMRHFKNTLKQYVNPVIEELKSIAIKASSYTDN
jgi:hypothetical protein